MTYSHKKLIAFLFLALATFLANAQGSKQQPNVVFILADDLGYGSINAYGADKSLLRTPVLNRLAEESMIFTDASTPASICSPTRIGFLTGTYPWRTSLKFGVVHPHDPLIIDPDTRTIADVFHDQGYQTAAIGKWHLGYGTKKRVDHASKLTPGPLDLGFDYHFGVPQNHGDNWGVYVENDHVFGLRSKKISPFSRSFYGDRYIGIDAPHRINKDVTPELADKAVEWLKGLDKEKPFFLYFAAVAVHRPITPSDEMWGMSDCGPYGDFIQDLDQSVGTILGALDYMGVSENTIVIFTSDNGGEFGFKEKNAPETFAIRKGLKLNGDLRGDKESIWEGGTRVPFMVKWPGKVTPGSVSNALLNIVDVFATLDEIVSNNKSGSGKSGSDSFSFLGILLQNEASNSRETMVTADVSGRHAIRSKNWKYIDDTPPEGLPEEGISRFWKKGFQPQLYDLEKDPGETVNLYDSRPEVVEKLKKELNYLRKNESRQLPL